MKQSLVNTSKALLLAGCLVMAAVSGTAQAHSGVDYSVPAKLLLLSAFLEPLHHHGRNHYSHGPRRSGMHDHHGRHHHKARDRHRGRHSHSRGGYRDDHRIKRRFRD